MAFIILMILNFIVVYAETYIYDSDTKVGIYTKVNAWVSGYWVAPPGEIHYPNAKVKGEVIKNLPINHGLYVKYRFEYDGVVKEGYLFDLSKNNPGDYLLKRAVLPTVVGYVKSDGRSGYAHLTEDGPAVHYDTAWASASIPII